MDARRRALQEKIDPWVVVGTTTVDGLISQVVERIGGNANDLMGWQEPRDVGGRMLVGHEFNTTQDGIVVMRCDIVRRRSEINAEKANAAADRLMAAVERYEQEHATTCPECGPHGNAGRVLLLESWVDCTTCRPTSDVDAWLAGEAPVSETDDEYRQRIRSHFDPVSQPPGGFEVPTVAELTSFMLSGAQSSTLYGVS